MKNKEKKKLESQEKQNKDENYENDKIIKIKKK